MINKARLIHNTIIKLKKLLTKRRISDISMQMDIIYYACFILYKILFKFNISYTLGNKLEIFLKGGFGLISSEELTEKIDELIEFCKEILKITNSIKEKYCE